MAYTKAQLSHIARRLSQINEKVNRINLKVADTSLYLQTKATTGLPQVIPVTQATHVPKKWRGDLRCGKYYPAEDGNPAECDPAGTYPCCSTGHWCGNTALHCDCRGCIDYSDSSDQPGGCQDGNGVSYRGTVSVTETGRTCQRWDSHFPHPHDVHPANHPLSGLDGNYCRNPDGSRRVWCYTTDLFMRWDYCDVPICEAAHVEDSCPDGYKLLVGTCIQLFTDEVSHDMAAQACESKRATLAMPKTGELDGALRELVMTVGGNQEYWIGLWEGETDTGWQWVDGTPLQTNDYQGWNPGEPSNYGFVWGNCVQYWSGSTGYPMWDDTDCFIFKRFICQAPRL
uniref:C-type lectin domain-containing protein n=1 Tax=Branchiostoma floridae TaxID=7739 RepID=C3ZIV8_BRAFL|eukprot:XP_002591548.1 hypothetical protein BRAFLDRAFT_92778 [Branchiostoma floridae]